ncbi:GyrI-like domain-containing protein [Cytobacillus sp. FSL K6-0265]|uniref:GyrI-like domain-containing protein n=1 Tax=Cytobacillus sp. FSL K6-0265 TaxID=2921448 RepID=UPI0030F5035E
MKVHFLQPYKTPMAKVYSEWLPSSNYELIRAPNFSFTKMDQLKPGYAYSEVWIPVMKK